MLNNICGEKNIKVVKFSYTTTRGLNIQGAITAYTNEK
jgi:hypothetical protein